MVFAEVQLLKCGHCPDYALSGREDDGVDRWHSPRSGWFSASMFLTLLR